MCWNATPAATTWTGVDRRWVVPSPSCPRLFSPQHQAAPLPVTAQVCDCPAAIRVNRSVVETATGAWRAVSEPSPSWPLELLPQHQADPSLVRPHVCAPPPETRSNLRPPSTGNGTSAQPNGGLRHVVTGGGTPSWPVSSLPQQ